jgi:nucleoside-diphosphate-sugar epimerase
MPRTALVTGGASGLGAASAARLRAEGLTVITLDVSGLADVTADVTDEAALRQVAGQIGPVDVLVNSAGIVGANKPLLETTALQWRRVLDVNVLGTVNTMRIFVPGMRERGWGRVVNLASMAGKDGNTCRGLRLVANAWRLYRQAVFPPVLPRRAVLLALISDADWVRDESGRRVLDASGAEGQQIEDLTFDADEIGWGVGLPLLIM